MSLETTCGAETTTQWVLPRPADEPAVSAADLLRIFDRLRRQVARDRHGSDGIFLGYDQLELSLDRNDDGAWEEVRATARVRQVGPRRQTVAYVAEGVSVDGRARRLAAGTGVTVLTDGRGHRDCSGPNEVARVRP